MYYTQTIIIYLSLFIVIFLLAQKASKQRKWSYIIGCIFIYSIIFGLRYDVGMDYLSYLDSYEKQGQSYNSYSDDFEPGFTFIIKALTSVNAHFFFFFALIAFTQIYLVFKALRQDYRIYPYLIFTFMLGCIWLDFGNGLRQVLALCIYIYSLSLLNKKYWFINCTICILIAISMHKSAIFLIPIYFLLRKKEEWFSILAIQLILFSGAYIIGNIGIIQAVIGKFDALFSYMQYENYLERTDLEDMLDRKVSRGIGFYGILITDILLLLYSNKIKNHFSSNKLIKYFYNFYFIGILIRYAFLSSMIIQRINVYFYYFKFIFAAYALLYAKKKNIFLFIMLIFLYILYFVGILMSMEKNKSMYMFFWQVN